MPSLTGLDYRLHSLEREKDNCCCYWKYHITCINLICINGKCQYYEKTMLCKTTEVCSAEWLLKVYLLHRMEQNEISYCWYWTTSYLWWIIWHLHWVFSFRNSTLGLPPPCLHGTAQDKVTLFLDRYTILQQVI